MANWETYSYQFGLEHVQNYVPGNEVTIFTRGSDKSTKTQFKEWRGIISHVHSKSHNGRAECVVFIDHIPVVVCMYDDKSPTILCYLFEGEIAWAKLTEDVI